MTEAKVILVDSYETGNEAKNANDGNPETIWYTAYNNPVNFAVINKQKEQDYPHKIQIELTRKSELYGFTYVLGQERTNSYVVKYEFYINDDDKN